MTWRCEKKNTRVLKIYAKWTFRQWSIIFGVFGFKIFLDNCYLFLVNLHVSLSTKVLKQCEKLLTNSYVLEFDFFQVMKKPKKTFTLLFLTYVKHYVKGN